MGKNAAQWLMKSIEQIVVESSPKYFYTFREGDLAYTLQWSSNSFGLFLLLTELKVGGARRSILISEGKAKNGWRVFGLGLRKMLEPENYVHDGSGHLRFVAQPLRDNSRVLPFKTFADTVRGHQVQVSGRNQQKLLNTHDKGKWLLGDNRGEKQNSVSVQRRLSATPVSTPGPTTLGGRVVGYRSINGKSDLGETNPVGNNRRFPWKFKSSLNVSVFGKERDLRNSYWTGEAMAVEVNGEGNRRVAWNPNKGGLRSTKLVTKSQREHVVGFSTKMSSIRLGWGIE
ncbi:hypothetical protein CFP56_031150 [Quercus suber]|uniref:rRNA N-glycosidase n=1 Tax=Quercus suber TaxID=58331 RepID=A0AAW0JMU3_QUESU